MKQPRHHVSVASPACPDCALPTRRNIIKTAMGGMAAVTAASLWTPGGLQRVMASEAAASGTKPAAETLVAQLFKSLTDSQKKIIAFPFDHPLRSKVDNNWMVVDKAISAILTPDQLALVKEIFIDMHSEEYADRVLKQVESDNEEVGGFKGCSIALFGEPGDMAGDPLNAGKKSKFEFVFAGRHVTRRCDGNSVDGAAFGGPIFYGHAAGSFREKPDHPGNAYWFQALRANEVFKALDGKQRKIALLDTDPRAEQGTKTVALRQSTKELPGVGMRDLSVDQKDLVKKVMADLLAPFRKPDADEAMNLIEHGGIENLHMAFYSKMDIGNDGVWDVWQIEGPNMIWYFRGAPHVHTWVHVREPEKA